MHFGINVPNFDIFSDPHLVAQLAQEAEEAGWDGFFLWDHIGADWPSPIADPWIELAAMAMKTQRIKLGLIVTPLPRRRPWKVARETVTLDYLSRGRLIVGAGIGSDVGREYSCFGEEGSDKLHGSMLDEGLEVLTKLWSGETFTYTGEHYQIQDARFLPTPVQMPRIPIWIAAVWPNKKPFRRAARWDGVVPMAADHMLTPAEIHDIVLYIQTYRTVATPFDVACGGSSRDKSSTEAASMFSAYAEAGLTWWMEGFDWHDSIADVRRYIHRGPSV